MFAEQCLRIVAGLFVAIWVARHLGPEQFGLLSYVLSFTAIFGVIAKLGLDGILVRQLVNHPEKRDTFLGTAFWLKMVGAMLVLSLLGMIIPFTSNDNQTNLFIIIIAAGLYFQSFEVIQFYFQSQVLGKVISVCKVIQLALSSAIKIYLVLSQADLIAFVAVSVFDALSLAIAYAAAYRLKQAKPAFYKNFDLDTAKILLKDSWPIILSALAIMIYMRIDQIMIKEMLGDYEVGIYSAAARITEASYVVPTLLTAALFPAILNAKKRSEKLYRQRLQNLYSLLVWSALIITFVITALHDRLILIFFGQPYQEAGPILAVHIWASIFVFMGVASDKWYIAENLQKLALFATSLGAVINVILNFHLIPKFQASGAAYATVFSYVIAAYISNSFWRASRPNFLMLTKCIFFLK